MKKREQIAELCAAHHAFDVIFALWASYGVARPDTLRPLAPGPPATAQYVAHVLLDRSSPEPVEPLPLEELGRRSVDIGKLAEIVGAIVQWLPTWFSYRHDGDQEELDPWLDLRTRFYAHRLAIPGLTYEWQEADTLRRLFQPFDAQLSAALGFGVDQALTLVDALLALPTERAAARGAKAREFADFLKADVAARRRGDTSERSGLGEQVQQLAKQPKAEADRRIDHLAMTWMGLAIGQDAAFTAEQLATAAGVPASAAEGFLEAFSIDFGARADRQRWIDDPARAVGGELSTMRRRPILHDGDGRYLPAAVDSVMFGLRDVLVDALKQPPAVWKRFDRHRARSLEEGAVDLLSAALGADWAHTGVKFRYRDEDGAERQGEVDGVMRVDNLLILLESKAGALAPSARRAAPERLQRGLKDLIVDAHEQLERAKAALFEGRATEVLDSGGNPLDLDLEGVSRCLPIAVTLEDLSAVAPAVWQLQEAGLMPADERAPWAVGIHELELICELTERPAQLVHYVQRRLRSAGQRIWGMDELDFFMRYLNDGLYFESEQIEGVSIDLGSHTDALDRYMYGEQGRGKKSRRPKQKIDNATRNLLNDIEATGSPGRTEAQLMILDMDEECRRRVSTALRRQAKRTRVDGKRHNETLVFEGDFAVSVHSVPPDQGEDLSDHLAGLGLRRAEKSGLSRWLGLGTVADGKSRLRAMSVLLGTDRLDQD